MLDTDEYDGKCCKIEGNLELEKSSTTTSSFIVVRRCKVCGRRHFGMTIKPIELGMTLKGK